MTETARAAGAVGTRVDRVDGPVKVTGAARYPGDSGFPGLAHAVLIQSTIAAGRITRIGTARAQAAPGVLAVITHRNAPRLARWPGGLPPPLQDARVAHQGQHIAVVVAETAEEAAAAAPLVETGYEPGEPLLDLDDPRAARVAGRDVVRGDVAAGLAAADVTVEATYTTPAQTHNPMGPFATTAFWDGGSLTVHDCTQGPVFTRAALAVAFAMPEERIRVLAPFVGGAFGAGLRTWPHVVLAAAAARMVGRPVRLVLTRAQMFTSVGYRPPTVQHLTIGASRTGGLLALDHECTEPTALEGDFTESPTRISAVFYACPHVSARTRQVRLNVACPTWMRGPGEVPGMFALECALDELAYKLGMDAVELRLRNYADVHPQTHRPWSAKALRECYERGAERFGWPRRTPVPRSMRSGARLTGYGMASAYFGYVQEPCQAKASLRCDGTAIASSAATDIGPGTSTVMTQVAAQTLGLPLERVRFELGDTDLPPAPRQGGSGLTAALGSAVRAACLQLVRTFADLAAGDPQSPLHGCRTADVTAEGGRISLRQPRGPVRGEAYTAILARHGLAELSAGGASGRREPGTEAGAFGATFAEAEVDSHLGLVHVTRVVAAVDGGRILNEKTAASQIAGGITGGIGMALLEQTVSDPGTGRIVNAAFGDYLVAVTTDVPDVDVIFTGGPDPANPVGVKGIGEIALVGVAPAIANAVFHATGRRIRSLPITPEKLL